MRHRLAVPTLMLCCLLAAGCGIRDQESADRIELGEFGANGTSTTTAVTSDSTTPDASVPPSTVPPERAPFPVYFASGTGLVAVDVDLPADPSLQDVADALAAGPPPDAAAAGDRSLVLPGLVRTMTLRDSRLTIDLDGAVLDQVDSAEQRQLIGQLVLSFAEHPGITGIDQWLFTIDHQPLRVIRRDGTLSQPGVPVERGDYDVLDEGVEGREDAEGATTTVGQ